MPGWLKWSGIGCLGLIALVFVLPFVGFFFANSFGTFLVILLVLLVPAGKVSGEEGQEAEEGQPSGFAATALGILLTAVLDFGVTATGKAITRMIRKRAKAAELDGKRYSAHSLRAGLVAGASAAKVSDKRIMDQTGHCYLPMGHRYVREAELFEYNLAAFLVL